jgi:predicted dehydrogenase
MNILGKNKPDIIDIKRMSPLPERIADVSAVIDMMVHDIDLARRIARSEMKYINAIGKKVKTNKLDQALAVIAFKNGVVANIEASRVHTEKARKVIVAIGKAIYDADLLSKTLKIKTDGVSKDIEVEAYDQLNTELKDFISAIMKRKEPSVTGEDGLAALEIAQKIEEAALRS